MDENSSRPKATESQPETDSAVPLPARAVYGCGPDGRRRGKQPADNRARAQVATEHGRRRAEPMIKAAMLRAMRPLGPVEAGMAVRAVPICRSGMM